MSFSIDIHGLPAIGSYTDALARWTDTKPWRGSSVDDPRPLDNNRSKRHMTIHLKPSGDIALRLHRTDVVTYHPDGAVTVEPWGSVSTNKFAHMLLPSRLTSWFNNSVGPLMITHQSPRWWADGGTTRVYKITGPTVFHLDDDGMWQPARSVPFKLAAVNRKRANAVLKACRFTEFKVWLETCEALDTGFCDRAREAYRSREDARLSTNWSNVRTLLADQSQWFRLAGLLSFWGSYTLDDLRAELIGRGGALDVTELPYLDSTQTVTKIERSHRQWRQYI